MSTTVYEALTKCLTQIKKEYKMEEKRISKQELQKIYGVHRDTIELWRKKWGLPLIEVSPYKRYVRKKDLLEWENSMIEKNIQFIHE